LEGLEQALSDLRLNSSLGGWYRSGLLLVRRLCVGRLSLERLLVLRCWLLVLLLEGVLVALNGCAGRLDRACMTLPVTIALEQISIGQARGRGLLDRPLVVTLYHGRCLSLLFNLDWLLLGRLGAWLHVIDESLDVLDLQLNDRVRLIAKLKQKALHSLQVQIAHVYGPSQCSASILTFILLRPTVGINSLRLCLVILHSRSLPTI